MIKNGMWFKNEEHYRFYLSRIAIPDAAMKKFQDKIFKPLIKRASELLTENHCFRLELKNADRNIDKKSWKEISRWLRIARNKTEEQIDQKQLTKQLTDLTSFGTSISEI